MAAGGSKSAQARTQAERARLHTARTEWHDGQIRRRSRDNAIAAIVGGLVVIAAIASQFMHAQVVAPEPTPTSTVAPTDAPVPTDAPLPDPLPSDAPVPSDAPAE